MTFEPSGAETAADDWLVIRPCTPMDVKAAARLHAAQLPHGFFPKLGPRFLREYYRSFISSPFASAFVAGPSGQVQGLLVGVLQPREHKRWLLRRRAWRLALVGLVSLLARPSMWSLFLRDRLPRYVDAVRGWRSAGPLENKDGGSSSPATAILAHIVIRAEARGRGVGAALTERFVAQAREAGVEVVRATTMDGPAGASGFYERNGWQRHVEATDWDNERIVVFLRPTNSELDERTE